MFKSLQGVSFKKGVFHFQKTGADIPLGRDLFNHIWKIGTFFVVIKTGRLKQKLTRKSPHKSIAFFPQKAGPWYNARLAAEMVGYKIVDDPKEADYHFAFSDDTVTTLLPHETDKLRKSSVNLNATDISKETVGKIFERIFGYGIKVDPTTFRGPVVEKSEANGTHDGRVIICPIKSSETHPDAAYQRLIPTGTHEGKTEDLRLLYVMNKPVIVFHKIKDERVRFGTEYLDVLPCEADSVFSPKELDLIDQFCHVIGLDFGALDVLRSTEDGKIYIVDVNKTGMPVISLSLRDQYKAFKKIAAQFDKGLLTSQG